MIHEKLTLLASKMHKTRKKDFEFELFELELSKLHSIRHVFF